MGDRTNALVLMAETSLDRHKRPPCCLDCVASSIALFVGSLRGQDVRSTLYNPRVIEHKPRLLPGSQVRTSGFKEAQGFQNSFWTRRVESARQ